MKNVILSVILILLTVSCDEDNDHYSPLEFTKVER